jgi:hypothetical protein
MGRLRSGHCGIGERGGPRVAASKTWPHPGLVVREEIVNGPRAAEGRPERNSVGVRCPVPQEQGEHDASHDH